MTEKRIGVVYLTDGKRDDLTYTSAVALGLNHARAIDIHIVQSGFSATPPPAALRVLQARGHRLATHALSPSDRARSGHGHITSTAYEKAAAIAAVSGDHDIVCYLDNDTLAMRPLDLADAAPKTEPVAAVPDLSVCTGLDNPAFFRNCDKHGLERRYFNSGFMAINVPRWIGSDIAERFYSAAEMHAQFCPYWDGSCTHVDQCAFNIAAGGRWETLPVEFNVQKSAFQTSYWNRALIRHYTGPEKFLPARAHRIDGKERAALGRVSRNCAELGLDIPPAYALLFYWANRLRRRAYRARISQMIGRVLEV
ncbi:MULTISPECIES: glycosyltransferase [unclassified Mesorhizobium]|uniref:glycosyltransferase family 8 protein n=1 Tax=unclassified Mesorhizobium TaxID=325217 RepID=UPI0024166E51|nr:MULTISPECIES: glycosyltransferase [unclassified Mesorhizobium]WFP62623.1 glycosyltransferase [Mesorhizobium sp. WSM4904]WFP75893.1 glycosyltransferase [Mesorhizobium sp. WSM4906]